MAKLRLTVLYPSLLGGTLLVVGCLFIAFLNHFMKQNALEEAAEKAEILLHRNLATHLYFSHDLKPEVLRLTDSCLDPDYFHPSWMSSTYAVRGIEKEFQGLESNEYSYKECAINARSPENEADSYEAEFIRKLNEDPKLELHSEIREIDGKPFFVILHRGEVMKEACLRCHSKAENAPVGMVDIYGDSRSFSRSLDEVVSAISIRIPLQAAFEGANVMSIKLALVLVLLLLGFFAVMTWLGRRLVFSPLETVRQQALEISKDKTQLGKVIEGSWGRELDDLTTAFNSLSVALHKNCEDLENQVEERTRSLDHSNREIIAQRQFLEAVLENVEDGIVACDGKGMLNLFNRAARQFHGIREQELPPDQWSKQYQLYLPDGRTPMSLHEIPLYRAYLGEHVRNVEMVIVSGTGRKRVLLASGQQMTDADGRVLGAVISLHDITHRKEAEEQLRQINEQLKEIDRLKSMFIASMSHELRTPLNSILGFSGVLVDGMSGPLTDQQQDHLNRINRAARHLLAMINEIIDISKIEAGQIDTIPENFLLNDLVAEAVGLIHQRAKRKGIEVETDIPAGLEFFTDRKRLFQCLLNLLGNSVKFSSEGLITVTATEKEGGIVQISVADTGIGMEKGVGEQIFKPFGRLPAGAGEKGVSGSGLGLYLTKKIVEEMLGGKINFKSTVGEGSTFWLQLPKRLDPVLDNQKEET